MAAKADTALVARHLVKFRGDSIGTPATAPVPTITSGAGAARPAGAAHAPGLAAPCLVQMGHGEGKTPGKRFSHGINDIQGPLGTIVASGGGQGVMAAFLEQANGGFYEGGGRDARNPVSTITASGSQQQPAAGHRTPDDQHQCAPTPVPRSPAEVRRGALPR